ncbi:MAG: hypothetical protein AAGA85_12215 [Bacteroidota bacterium]
MEEWKNQILKSIEGIERAQAPSGAFQGIKDRITNPGAGTHESDRFWIAVAAAIAFILLSNGYFFHDYIQGSSPGQETYTTLLSNYNLYEQ